MPMLAAVQVQKSNEHLLQSWSLSRRIEASYPARSSEHKCVFSCSTWNSRSKSYSWEAPSQHVIHVFRVLPETFLQPVSILYYDRLKKSHQTPLSDPNPLQRTTMWLWEDLEQSTNVKSSNEVLEAAWEMLSNNPWAAHLHSSSFKPLLLVLICKLQYCILAPDLCCFVSCQMHAASSLLWHKQSIGS